MTIYRKIYEQHFGSIPIDEFGRSYDIHHIDGNRKNNNPSNLIALSIQEHYNMHYNQCDWGACFAISMRMQVSLETISERQSELAKKSNKQRVAEGTHNFLDKNKASERAKLLVLEKKHPWLSEEHKQTTKNRNKLLAAREKHPSQIKVKEGKHHFQTALKEGRHPTQWNLTCPHCEKTGRGQVMKRWHFDRCKLATH